MYTTERVDRALRGKVNYYKILYQMPQEKYNDRAAYDNYVLYRLRKMIYSRFHKHSYKIRLGKFSVSFEALYALIKT